MMYNSLIISEQEVTVGSRITILNMMNHVYMVTIIGQIKPWGHFKRRTTCFIQHMEQVQSSLPGKMKFGDIRSSREMMSVIAKGCVNRSSSAHYHITNVSALVMMLEDSIATTQRTIWNSIAMPYFRQSSISYLWVGGYIKRNKFNEGNIVFPDALSKMLLIALNCLLQACLALHCPVHSQEARHIWSHLTICLYICFWVLDPVTCCIPGASHQQAGGGWPMGHGW